MFKSILSLGLATLLATGCTSTEDCGNGNGTIGGKTHLNTTGFGFKLLFGNEIGMSAEIKDAVDATAAVAKEKGASNIQIVQSSSTNLWWVLFPFTLVINPVITNVAADAK
ncbi:MAG: hypothetical protein AB7F75_00495 [Planctomycetota bacterium]